MAMTILRMSLTVTMNMIEILTSIGRARLTTKNSKTTSTGLTTNLDRNNTRTSAE